MPVKACVFDAFGTLFALDVQVEQINEKCEGKGEALLAIWRRKQLEYSWLRTLMNQYKPFDQVTHDALSFAMDSLNIKNPKLYDLLMPIYKEAHCFPTASAMLTQLKEQNITTAILSNGTMEMLKDGVSNAKVEPLIDHIFSADSIKVYKPDHRVYQMSMSGLNLFEDEMLFISSNQWDIAGATKFGLQTVWINRNNEALEKLPNASHTISSLAELPNFIHSL